MNELCALESACATHPDDNTVHNALADWLEENGRTDRDAARVEWIRLSCGKPRKSNTTRVAGERGWLLSNVHRLWPTLWDHRTLRNISDPLVVRREWQMNLPGGAVELRVAVKAKQGGYTPSIVRLAARRGVCVSASVPSLRAAQTAPWVAADEPHTPIRFESTGDLVVFITPGRSDDVQGYGVRKTTLLRRGLVGVWDQLQGHDQIVVRVFDRTTSSVAVYPSNLHNNPKRVVVGAANAALTRWSRSAAGQEPGLPLIRLLDVEQLPATTLTAADVPEPIVFHGRVSAPRPMFRATMGEQA